MCSTLQAMNEACQDPDVRRRSMLRADNHMKFVMGLYEEKVKDGHYFLHGHLAWATSWPVGCAKGTLAMGQVNRVIGDQ